MIRIRNGMLNKTIMILMMAAALVYAQDKNKNRGQFTGFSKGYISGTYNLYPSFIGELNNEIKDFGAGECDESVFLYGGELCGNANSAFGIGIHYYTGSDQTQKIVEVDSLKLDRSVAYSMSFIGLDLNYRKSLYGPFEFFGAVSGSYGSVEIVLSQDFGDQSFGDMWDSFDPASYLYDYNRSVNYSSGLIIFSVNNGVRMFVSSRIAIGITVGYTYGFVSDKGEINYEFESIKNVPDLDFEGMNFGVGIYFGY